MKFKICLLLLVLSVGAQAETKTSEWIENSPYMVDFHNLGPGTSDMTRFYDSDTNIVCYSGSNSQGRLSCLEPRGNKLALKYQEYREAIERRKALELQMRKN